MAVGSCLDREHKCISKVERYVVMFNQCNPIIVDTILFEVNSQDSAKQTLS